MVHAIIGFVSPRQPTLGHVLLHVWGTAAVTAARGLHAAAALAAASFSDFILFYSAAKSHPTTDDRDRGIERM